MEQRKQQVLELIRNHVKGCQRFNYQELEKIAEACKKEEVTYDELCTAVDIRGLVGMLFDQLKAELLAKAKAKADDIKGIKELGVI